MKKSAKILTTIIIVIVWFILIAIVTEIRKRIYGPHILSAGWVGIIITIGVFAAIGAVWKK